MHTLGCDTARGLEQNLERRRDDDVRYKFDILFDGG